MHILEEMRWREEEREAYIRGNEIERGRKGGIIQRK
jgi:hypothetical protein